MYKHGVYSVSEKSELQSTQSIGTVPAYVGSLPVQRMNASGLADFNYDEFIKKPILLKSYNDVKKLGLYSDDWATYTACETIHAHFMNGNENVAPIVIVNLLDPKTLKDTATTAEVTLQKEGSYKVGYINDPLCNIDDLAITIESTALGKSDVAYSYEGDTVKITILKKDATVDKATKVSATYKQVSFTKDSVSDTEFKEAVESLKYCEFNTGVIPNVLVAPYFSKTPNYHDIMVEFVENKIADKWGLVAVTDIPSDTTVNTIELAKKFAKDNQYNSKLEKVCYPMAKKGDKTYHYSTLLAYTMQLTDLRNDDVPFVSPSNKLLNCDAAVLEDGTPFLMTEKEANSLNEVGITTMNIIRRRLHSWGSHMANYDYEKLDTIPYEERSDANIRMGLYLTNYLQYNYIEAIDTPFTRKDVDGVITSVQQWLNSLVNEGKLLYATISFNEDENTLENLVNGDFVFDVTPTYTPNAKSLTFKTCYSTVGLSSLTGGNE